MSKHSPLILRPLSQNLGLKRVLAGVKISPQRFDRLRDGLHNRIIGKNAAWPTGFLWLGPCIRDTRSLFWFVAERFARRTLIESMPTATAIAIPIVYSWFALQVWNPSFSIDRLEQQQYIVNRDTF